MKGNQIRIENLETPAGPTEIETQNFNHPYIENSMKIIDLLLTGKNEMVLEQRLITKAYLNSVFYEEPIEHNEDQEQNQMKSKKDQQFNRKDFEKRKFLENKVKGNDQEYLYLIDALWIKKWINYVRYSSSPNPGFIINDQIYYKVEIDHKLILGEEAFLISNQLWNCLFDWYGGGPTLKWKIDPTLQLKEVKNKIQHSSDSKIDKQTELLKTNNIDQRILQNRKFSDLSNEQKLEEQKKNFAKLATDHQNHQKRNSKQQTQEQNSKVNDNFNSGIDLQDLIESQKLDYKDKTSSIPTKRESILSRSTQNLTLFGLENNSFYCYLNAVLQCFLSIEEIRQYYEHRLYNQIQISKPLAKDLKFSQSITEICQNITNLKQNQQMRIIRTYKLRKLIKSQFSPMYEHDSHEFLLYFLNNLKDELTEKGSSLPTDIKFGLAKLWQEFKQAFPSVIDQKFTLIENTVIKCQTCQQQTQSLQYYLTFPLQVENMPTLEDSLRNFNKQENLDDYKCEKCNSMHRQCTLQRKIIKLPEIFIFQLQRFAMYPMMRKIRGQLRFSEKLEMKEFIDQEFIKDQCNAISKYELIGVAVHTGNIHGGHYVAYSKKEDGHWYYMNDERVGRVSIDEVLSQDAYLLFYQKKQS